MLVPLFLQLFFPGFRLSNSATALLVFKHGGLVCIPLALIHNKDSNNILGILPGKGFYIFGRPIWVVALEFGNHFV